MTRALNRLYYDRDETCKATVTIIYFSPMIGNSIPAAVGIYFDRANVVDPFTYIRISSHISVFDLIQSNLVVNC